MSGWPAGAFPPPRSRAWETAATGRDEHAARDEAFAETFTKDRCPITR